MFPCGLGVIVLLISLSNFRHVDRSFDPYLFAANIVNPLHLNVQSPRFKFERFVFTLLT